MLISDRSKEIIEYLMNANGPLTVSDLAKELEVTKRTIYRQMQEVTEVIESFGLTLDHSSGQGMMIFGSLYNLKRLSQAFEDVKTEQSYSAKERVDMIILILLNEDQYVKTQSLAIDLNTSAQTIRNDFASVKEKIHTHSVDFEAKKSEGVRLVGKEIPKRHLFTNIIIQNVSPDNFLDWLKNEKYKQNPFISLLQKFDYEDSLKLLYRNVQPSIHKRRVDISDNELQEFLLLIGIFIKRHSLIGNQSDVLNLNITISDTESEFQQDIISILEKKFGIILYDNEKSYFHWMINLYVGRTHYQLNHPASALQILDNVSQLIGEIENKLHFPFSQDKNLAENLMLHVNMAMERIQNGITVSNPMLEEVYQSNPKLYEIVKQSFLDIFDSVSVPEDEIGYIVIYFIGSMDFLSKKSISVLVVCSTGIGSSKMLRSRLEREFTEIDVKKIISLHKLHDEDLDNYDFIISTVPLDLDSNKYLCVSPLLNEKEKRETRKRLKALHKKGDYYE